MKQGDIKTATTTTKCAGCGDPVMPGDSLTWNNGEGWNCDYCADMYLDVMECNKANALDAAECGGY